MDRKASFTKIYKDNSFRGKLSRSGPGSDLENTIILSKQLITLLNDLQIQTLIDSPCGDFNWMQYVIPEVRYIDKYIGIDIVSEVIENDKKLYGNNKIEFICQDMVEEFSYKGDLLICRDCLGHLSFKSVFKILKNLANSDIEYSLITTFTEDRKNYDCEDGVSSYAVNLTKEPFNLPIPSIVINEGCTEGHYKFKDKSLGLWTNQQLKDWYKERLNNVLEFTKDS